MPGLELHITEWGAPVRDFEPVVPEDGAGRTRRRRELSRSELPDSMSEHRRGMRSNELPPSPTAIRDHRIYMGDMTRVLAASELVGESIHFCISESMVTGFGLTDREFNDLPAGGQVVSVLQELGLLA